MIRFVFGILATVGVVRWSYNEAKLMFPESVPLIEAAAEYVQIPTHDKWGNYALGRAVLAFASEKGFELPMQERASVNKPNSKKIENCAAIGNGDQIQITQFYKQQT
jgi:hypothetical protein